MVFYHNPIKYISFLGREWLLWDITLFLAIILVGTLAFFYTKKKKLNYLFMLQLISLITLSVVLFAWYIPRFYGGSHSSFLGIFVGSFVALLFIKLRKKDYRYLDIIALFLPLGFAFARIGCFFNWCCKGIETILPWGVIVGDHAPVHPTQVYLIIINLVLFGVFFYSKNHKFFRNKPGNLTLSIFASYSFFRLFLVEPIRMIFEGTTRSITLSLIFSIALLTLYIRNRKR
jgi:prolipoprotein diacylglyceryltransferase